MYYLLFYKTIEQFIEKRTAYRQEHLKLVQEAHRNEALVMGGALAEPADGAVLVFKGENASVAEDFARNDPYVQNGLITEWSVRPWSVVIGGRE